MFSENVELSLLLESKVNSLSDLFENVKVEVVLSFFRETGLY